MAKRTVPFRKVLVANRGEIAIRVFRACTELGCKTVAVYSAEDRFSLHRYKADEAYQVGLPGSPVKSYLDVEEIIAVALHAQCDAIHPGYGFLSERAELVAAAQKSGISCITPSEETLMIAGDKVQTRALAERCGVPVIPGATIAAADIRRCAEQAEALGFPVMVKASFGGGGRGMRRINSAEEVGAGIESASAEALAAFGRAEIFLEKYIERPKHLEVQLLGDGTGEVVHLYERDCSVQRRHQKVTEFAPAIALSPDKRAELLEYALTLGRALSLRSAATAEFLLSEDGKIYFIEINPRIQVEHTVTEEITGIDIVQSQIRIASGESLADLGLQQETIRCSGVAIQCRITSENPENDFAPDYGTLVAYRSASGFGIRLDAGSAFTGAVISPYYDSLLVKVTARAGDMRFAASRMRRALSEFRIRGVRTNIPFLENLLRSPEFLSGEARTDFLEAHPELKRFPKRKDRANKLLKFLGEVTVNGHALMPGLERPRDLRPLDIPRISVGDRPLGRFESPPPPPAGWRDRYRSMPREQFFAQLRETKELLVTDTTLRDAHQSLMATRMRTFDMLPIADVLAQRCSGLFSLEMWGGATFDVALRFLLEDPWERVALLRKRIPNVLFQMLLRGANGVGYKTYPDNLVTEFTARAVEAGIDVFRIFDSLNNVDRMANALRAVRDSGGIAEGCICYTGDVLAESVGKVAQPKFTLAYYQDLTRQLIDAGTDIIAIKDMAGLLRPYAATILIDAIRDVTDLPIHLHSHDTAGGQIATYIKAAESGVDVVDCAFASLSGTTSQPSLEALVAALENTPRQTSLVLSSLTPLSTYWEGVRAFYQPFESDLKSSTAEVYANEIPGGQYSNFRPQAESLGLGDKWQELKQAYTAVNKLFGGIVKVTPSSKVVGDMAIFMVANDLSAEDVQRRAAELDFPASVVEFFEGELGTPYGGFPEPLRTAVLRGKSIEQESKADPLPDADFAAATRTATEMLGREASIRDALSYLLYPHVFKEYAQAQRSFGDVSWLPSLAFFYGLDEGEEVEIEIEAGKRLIIKLVSVGDPQPNGMRRVYFELNGQARTSEVRDRAIVSENLGHGKSNPSAKGEIGAPLAGALVSVDVKEGDVVSIGTSLCTVEAMKMQTIVRAPFAGKIKKILLKAGTKVDVADLILVLE
jgi:pyruvate carboxylase